MALFKFLRALIGEAHTWAKQLLPGVATLGESTALPGQGPFLKGLIANHMVGSHTDHQREQCIPQLTDNIRQLLHAIPSLASFLGRDVRLWVAFWLPG